MRFALRSIVLLVLSATVAQAQNAVPMQAKPLDPANMDTSVSACSDFFQYANGGWIKRNPIPPAFALWGGFSELSEANNAALLDILEKAAKNTDPKRSADVRKLGVYYSSCMDSVGAERAGVSPVRPVLSRINAISSREALGREISRLHGSGNGVLFGFGSTQDYKNSTSVIGGAVQGGLGLPDRDYYTRTDANSVDLRAKYVAHVANILKLAGESDTQARTDANSILAMETTLARNSLTRVQRRDPLATYHKMIPAELAVMTPHFNWKTQFEAEGNPRIPAVIVESPTFFKAVDSLIANQPLDVWKAYLRWHVLNRAAASLNSAFVNEDFEFNSALTG